MTTPEERTTTITSKEFMIPKDSVASDLGSLVSTIRRSIRDAGRDDTYDDAFHITADDETIIAYWEDAVHE